MADHNLSDTLVEEREDVMHPTPLEEKAQATPRPKNGETKFARRSLRVFLSKSSLKKRKRFNPEEVKDVIDLSLSSNGTGSCDFTADNSKSATDSKMRFSPEEVKDVIDLSLSSNGTGSCDLTADNSKSATDSKDIRVSSNQNTGSQSCRDGTDCHSSKEIPSESIPDDALVVEREVVMHPSRFLMGVQD